MTRSVSGSGRVSCASESIAQPVGPKGEAGACDETGFDLDELHEFLAADRVEVPVDPAFKERLRRKLWSMVRFRDRGRGGSGSSRPPPPC